MQHDQEGQKFRRFLVDGQVEEGRQNDRMAEAADGKQLGHPLQNGDQSGKQNGHRGSS